MKSSRVLMATGFLAGAISLSPAHADPGPWYVGAGAGATTYGGPSGDNTFVRAGEFTPSSFTATTHTDDSATNLRLDAGYRFSRYFALEGSYVDFGSTDTSFTTTSPSHLYTGSSKVSGQGLGAVGRWPLRDDFALFARAGLFRFKSDMNIAAVTVTGPAGGLQTVVSTAYPTRSASGTTGFLGAGADYALGGGFTLRAAWDYYRAKGDHLEMVGAHTLSVGVLYNF